MISHSWPRTPEGPWVCSIPEELVRLLAEARDKAHLDAILTAWHATEPLQDWDRGELLWSLLALCELARQAVRERKRLLMWICL
jgi:hypothetical protein